MKRHLFHLALLSILLGSAIGASAQAKYTATRRINLQAGGDFVADFPDYSRHKFYGYGVYATLDFTEHFGIEFDYRKASDTTERIGGGGSVPQYQRTFEGGVRYTRTYGRFYPYGKAMYGLGTFQYPPYPPPADQSIPAGKLNYPFIGLGGGTDYALTHHISIRADLEYQNWFSSKTNPSPNNINGLPRGLTPILYTGGVSYVFGPGNFYGPR